MTTHVAKDDPTLHVLLACFVSFDKTIISTVVQ